MTHDPLCPDPDYPLPRKCVHCHLIEEVREDMLAKCIAAVEAAICDERDSTRAHVRYDCCGCSTIDAMSEDALAALRALEEQP